MPQGAAQNALRKDALWRCTRHRRKPLVAIRVQVPIEASSIKARTPRATKSDWARKWAKPIGFSMWFLSLFSG